MVILDFFLENHHLFVKQNIAIAFESDYEPSFLERFISQLPNQQFGINYKILKLHNPWLREPHLNNKSRKQYFIELPKEGYYKN